MEEISALNKSTAGKMVTKGSYKGPMTEFPRQDPLGGRREPAPPNCPLISLQRSLPPPNKGTNVKENGKNWVVAYHI